MSQLERLIDEATDGTAPLSTLLRRAKVVASRIKSPEVGEWANREVRGYPDDEQLPPYRVSTQFPVLGVWTGPMGYTISGQPVSPVGLPEDFRIANFEAALRQPVAELEILSQDKNDPGRLWDPYALNQYEKFVAANKGGASFAMMSLTRAQLVIPRTHLIGVLEKIRNSILDLAIGLEEAGPNVGEPAGPTIKDEQVATVVQNFRITIKGDGNNFAVGDGAIQKSRVQKNDIESLATAARELGLSEEHVQELRACVEADGRQMGASTERFIDRVRRGTVALGMGIGSELGASSLLSMVQTYFGG